MATIQAPAGFCDLKPLNSSSISICNGIPSLPLSSIKTAPLSFINTRKLRSTSCSLLDDGDSSSTVTAIEIDPMLAVKTEVLRQISSIGWMVVSAGDGAVQSATNLSLLRQGISIWVDVPLDIIAKEIVEDGVRLIGTNISRW